MLREKWAGVRSGMVTTMLAAALVWPGAARAADTDDRVAIAVTPMVTRGPIDPTEVEGLELVLAASLQKEPRVRAIMPSEVQALLGVEAQKQLMGCEDDSSCLAEIGGALGAPYVLAPQVSRVGSTWLLQLSLLNAAASETTHRATREVSGLDPLVKAIKSAVEEILDRVPELKNATGPVAVGPTRGVAPPNKGSRVLFWIGLGTGVAMVAGGGGMWVAGQSTISRHNDAALSALTGERVNDNLLDSADARRAQATRNIGVLLTGVGAALIAADATLGAMGNSGAQASIVPLPGGAYATVQWRLK